MVSDELQYKRLRELEFQITCQQADKLINKEIQEKRKKYVIARGKSKTCTKGHELTEANTYKYNNGQRRCRICMKANSKKWYQSKKEG